MKKAVLFLVLMGFAVGAFGQQKPLTQGEYVQMLYGLQKNAGGRSEVIEALRKRGIDFTLTDGIRGLTRSKGSNDEELKRALEEANRRRQNPNAAKPPSESEAKAIIEKARERTLAAVEEMPDFVVKQQIQRSEGYAGTGRFHNRDNLIVAVSYRASGQEEYKLLSRNGVVQIDTKAKGSYEEVGGTSSTGEFVTVLAKIFKPDSEGEFTVVDTDVIRNRKSVVFDFKVTRDKAKQSIVSGGTLPASTITGMSGRLWVDRENFRVLRVESDATEIPPDFPVRTARRT
ncbi:MAG: hypothetical protein LC730_06525, partial [Acidobacteria bacterium]|nr:hypothetical protein [Acidobacteriota bacterium]